MTDQHVITPQENALYDHMTSGDWEAVEQLRTEALTADQTPPDPVPDDWLSPADQFGLDYAHAYSHYQADHEPHEDERVENRAVEVKAENTDAPDPPAEQP